MVIFLSIILTINEINNVLNGYFKDNIYDLFMDKYCFEYFLILKSIYPNSVLVVQKGKEHCAALIDNNVYDISGRKNINEFEIIDNDYEDFIYSFYNKFSDEEHEKIVYMVKNMKK